MGEIPFTGFRDLVFTRFSGCTDSLTDGQTQNRYASGTEGFGGRGIKAEIKRMLFVALLGKLTLGECDYKLLRWLKGLV